MSLEIEISGLTFKNPIIIGSAGYTEDENGLKRFIKRGYGGVVTKSTSKVRMVGAPPPRVFWYDPPKKTWLDAAEALRNPGIEKMVKNVRACKSLAEKNDCHIIGSVTLSSTEEAVYVATEFEKAGVSAIEMEMISPYGRHLGLEYATRGEYWGDPKHPEKPIEAIKAVKDAVDIPVWPKMHPTTLFLVGETIVKKSNPDAFTYIGLRFPTPPLGLAINVETGKPLFSGNLLLKIKKGIKFKPSAGLFPVWPTTILATALLKRKIKVPLIPSGGIRSGFVVIQAMMAGADAIEICTAVYKDLDIIESILREIRWFMSKKGYTSLSEIVGISLEFIPFELMEIPVPPEIFG